MIPQLKSIFNQNQLTQLVNLFTQRVNGLIGGKEDVANKQDSLVADGTGVKYPTVDAINAANFATETYADNAASAAAATKQNLFDYSGSASGTTTVTIDDLSGGVAEFTQTIVKKTTQSFRINSNIIEATSKIIPVLVYNGAGYPVILSQKIAAGRVDILVANLDVTGTGGANTNANILIEYQIVA